MSERLKRTNKEREIITRINGDESVEIEIYKEADANIVNVAKGVTDAVFGTPEQQAFVTQLEARKKEAEKKEKEEKIKSGKAFRIRRRAADMEEK